MDIKEYKITEYTDFDRTPEITVAHRIWGHRGMYTLEFSELKQVINSGLPKFRYECDEREAWVKINFSTTDLSMKEIHKAVREAQEDLDRACDEFSRIRGVVNQLQKK